MAFAIFPSMCMIVRVHTHHGSRDMRTNIDIDDDLMREVLKATGLKTKKEAVELGLKTLLRLKQQERIRHYKGKLRWTGDLEQMRETR